MKRISDNSEDESSILQKILRFQQIRHVQPTSSPGQLVRQPNRIINFYHYYVISSNTFHEPVAHISREDCIGNSGMVLGKGAVQCYLCQWCPPHTHSVATKPVLYYTLNVLVLPGDTSKTQWLSIIIFQPTSCCF